MKEKHELPIYGKKKKEDKPSDGGRKFRCIAGTGFVIVGLSGIINNRLPIFSSMIILMGLSITPWPYDYIKAKIKRPIKWSIIELCLPFLFFALAAMAL